MKKKPTTKKKTTLELLTDLQARTEAETERQSSLANPIYVNGKIPTPHPDYHKGCRDMLLAFKNEITVLLKSLE